MIPVSLLTGIVVARFLGPEGKGIIAMLTVPVGLVCAFGESGIRPASAFLLAKKQYSTEDIQASMLAVFCVTGPIAFLTVIIAYYYLGSLEYGWRLNVLFALTVPIILLRRYAAGLLLGRQMITRLNYVEIVNGCVILLGVSFFVALLPYGKIGVGVAYFLGALASMSLVLITIKKIASLRPRWVSPIPAKLVQRGLLYAMSLFVLDLNSRISLLMLGILQGKEHVGIYSVGSGISEMLRQIPLSIGVVLFARSLSWSPKEAKGQIDSVLLLLRIILPISVLGAGALYIIGYTMVPILYGEAFNDSVMVLAWLLPGTIPFSLFLFMHFYAAGQGEPHMALKGFIPASVLAYVLNLLLIPDYGYVGAALSSTISYIFGVGVYFYFFKRLYSCTFSNAFILKKSDFKLAWGMCLRKSAK